MQQGGAAIGQWHELSVWSEKDLELLIARIEQKFATGFEASADLTQHRLIFFVVHVAEAVEKVEHHIEHSGGKRQPLPLGLYQFHLQPLLVS